MKTHRRWAWILAVGLVIVSLSAAGVQAVGNGSTSNQSNYRGPARTATSTATKVAGQVQSNRPASAVLKPSAATSHLPVRTNNPALKQGGNSN
jgi:hypothetical protein